MRMFSRTLAGFAGAGLLACAVQTASAQLPAPVIRYDTWTAGGDVGGAPVINTGSSAIPGTAINGYTTPAGPDGTPAGLGAAAHFDDGNGGNGSLSTGINTNQTLNGTTGAGNDFTMAAWVNLDTEGGGDNMVFGTGGGNPVHLGFRGDQAYFGFWGNDSSSGNLTGNGITNGGSPVGNWNYFEWNWNASTGTQTIYENGQVIDSSGGHGGPSQGGETLYVATNGNNSGDLAGSIDDARVYNTSNIDPAALYADAAAADPIPEPASLSLIGLGAMGLLARRRRA